MLCLAATKVDLKHYMHLYPPQWDKNSLPSDFFCMESLREGEEMGVSPIWMIRIALVTYSSILTLNQEGQSSVRPSTEND